MFHLCKKSRKYQRQPYAGPTAVAALLPNVFETLEQARDAQALFTKLNPVGWDIYDAETGKKVEDDA